MITVPYVSINGTKREALVEQAMEIHDKLSAAYLAILQSDLAHPRNYQSAPSGVTGTAQQRDAERVRTEHFQWLHNRMQEYQQLAIDINEQGSTRLDR